MSKILCASDILLGEGFPHFHNVADKLRAARLEALRALLALARREEVEAVVIAGNLFADNRVGAALVGETAQLMGKSPIPVYLLPGHRDPITPDSPYQLYREKFQGQVHLMLTREPVVLPSGVVLYPCPVEHRLASGDPTRWIPERGKERLRLAVVNTHTDGYRLPPGCQDRLDLDAILAGGRVSSGQEGSVDYPGAPEATDFGQDAGFVSLIQLSASQNPVVEKKAVGALKWVEEAVEIASAKDVEQVVSRWSKDENRAGLLLRLTLTGSLGIDQLAAVASARRALAARLFHLDLRDEIVPTTEGLVRNPLLRTVASALAAQASNPSDYDPTSLAPDDTEIAREALVQLVRILETADHQDLK